MYQRSKSSLFLLAYIVFVEEVGEGNVICSLNFKLSNKICISNYTADLKRKKKPNTIKASFLIQFISVA